MAAACGVTTGCLSSTQSAVADVSPEGWREPVEIDLKNTDTISVRELRLVLRHSATIGIVEGRYAVERLSPWGDISRDTLAIGIQPDTQRNRTGEAYSSPERVRLTEPGSYRFTVTPLREMHGIWSVGIELEQTK